MPTSEAKPKQFAFVLSAAEMRMLDKLAVHDVMAKAALIRHLIRARYENVFRKKGKGRDMKLQKWEFQRVMVDYLDEAHLLARLNQEGQQGWQVAAITSSVAGTHVVTFQRPVTEKVATII